MTAREVAVKLIEPYVLRGDDPDWIKQPMGSMSNRNWVTLNVNGRTKGRDKIIVERLDGRQVNAVFSFREIYDEIQRSRRQPALL